MKVTRAEKNFERYPRAYPAIPLVRFLGCHIWQTGR